MFKNPNFLVTLLCHFKNTSLILHNLIDLWAQYLISPLEPMT